MGLRVEHAPDGVVTLVLDNPERRNALDADLAAALVDEIARIRADRTTRCVVVTGEGVAFCSGADLGALRGGVTGGVLPRRDALAAYYRVFLDIRDLPVPTVAAVNGPAVGAGLNLALCCDLRVAAESARFGATFVRLGIHPGGGAAHLLTRLVGPGAAAELLLVGEPVGARRALELGLVNSVVADAELRTAAGALAASIATNSPQAVRATKRALRLALDSGFEAVLEVESLAQAATHDSEEAAEGWAAFRERRRPRFGDR